MLQKVEKTDITKVTDNTSCDPNNNGSGISNKHKIDLDDKHNTALDDKYEESTINEFDDIDMILNPHFYAFENTIKAIEESNLIEHKIELIDELLLVFTDNEICYNRKIQSQFVKLVDMLQDQELYKYICVLISDIVRHKPVIQKIFFDLHIFDFLRFDGYSSTYSLVFSVCYGNKELTDYFFRKVYNEERDKGNELVDVLKGRT